MDLQSEIDRELWKAVKSTYEHQNYSGAILDAMYFLSELIRNKTGLEGDGAQLISNAFTGTNPKIKINMLQTDSDISAQKGMAEILRGMYLGIRNPRSHDRLNDTKHEADSIIYFINYLTSIIAISRLSFEENAFLERVFDEHYVATQEYSQLLVEDIPIRQRKNIAIKVIMSRTKGNTNNLKYFVSAILRCLDEHEISEVMRVSSEELRSKKGSDAKNIRTIIGIFEPEYWIKLDKDVRIRIENILLKEVRLGEYNEQEDECLAGALATWIPYRYPTVFNDKDSWISSILYKLQGDNLYGKSYVERYLMQVIIDLNTPTPNDEFRDFMEREIEKNNQLSINLIYQAIEYDPFHPWRIEFKEEIKSFNSKVEINDDDLPF